MTEADYGPSFQIIAAAGDSKGYSISAIKAAQNGEFEQAEADMKVQDYDGDRIAIFEVKYSRRLEDLPYDCERAIKQIDVNDGIKEICRKMENATVI